MVLHHNRTAHAPWGRVTGSGARATRSSGTLGRESRGLGRGPRAHEAHQKLRAQSGPIRRLVHKRQRSCNSNVRCTRKHNGFRHGNHMAKTWQRRYNGVAMAWWLPSSSSLCALALALHHYRPAHSQAQWLCTINSKLFQNRVRNIIIKVLYKGTVRVSMVRFLRTRNAFV